MVNDIEQRRFAIWMPTGTDTRERTVIRHYGTVQTFQSQRAFYYSSAAYMAVQSSDNASAAYWYSEAVRGGIHFC